MNQQFVSRELEELPSVSGRNATIDRMNGLALLLIIKAGAE